MTKVYEPSPLWLRFLLRSAITEPVTALDAVSLTLDAGTICAVVGPNGAGKSTLFRVMTGLTTATNGSVSIDNLDIESNGREARRLIGFVPAGDQTLYLRMSCVENLRFHGRLAAVPERQLNTRIAESLEQVGLGEVGDRVGFALSSGMRARLLLARAILHRPRLLILDEPTATVDPVGSYELLEIINEIVRANGVSVLLSSHRLEEIEALHDQVVLLYGGRIIYKGNLDTFREEASRPHIRLTFSDPGSAGSAETAFSTLDNIEVVFQDGCTIEVSTSRKLGNLVQQLGPDLLACLVDVREHTLPLRDLLQQVLTGQKIAQDRT